MGRELGDLPQPGDVVGGRLRLEHVIGRGAFGVVMRAQHLALRAPVAVKFLAPSVLEDAEAVARFLREARAAVRIQNEHVVRVMDVATLPSGLPYIVMELLEGESLAERVDRAGPVPFPEAIGYALDVCEGLGEAHALGIVHRDLKPANLFLTRRASGAPVVKVLDFGMSKFAERVPAPELAGRSLTRTNTVMGSPLFMSPEQFRDAKAVDARSDVWSLGAVLHYLLTATPPFQAPDLFTLAERVRDAAPVPPSTLRREVPRALDQVVLRCLEKDPARRFPHAAALAEALLACLPGGRRTSGAFAPVALEATQRQVPAARSTRWLILAAAWVVVTIGVAMIVLATRDPAPPPPLAAPAPAPAPAPVAPAPPPAVAPEPPPVAEPKRPHKRARPRPASRARHDEDVLRTRR